MPLSWSYAFLDVLQADLTTVTTSSHQPLSEPLPAGLPSSNLLPANSLSSNPLPANSPSSNPLTLAVSTSYQNPSCFWPSITKYHTHLGPSTTQSPSHFIHPCSSVLVTSQSFFPGHPHPKNKVESLYRQTLKSYMKKTAGGQKFCHKVKQQRIALAAT
ncbi:hypothetical protein BYT27DRAFT_7193623 [Phlegmacium glaucopus]|nr:hypothetical protein BYT27DRAFT_7193623 [Phlegmacium glaucopus]